MTKHRVGKKRSQLLADTLADARKSIDLCIAGIRTDKSGGAAKLALDLESLLAARAKVHKGLDLLRDRGFQPVSSAFPVGVPVPKDTGVQVSGKAR